MGFIDVASGQWNFPSRDVSESEKNQAKYNLQYTQAMYNRYLSDKGGVWYSTRSSLDLIRLYGKGTQPSDIYKTMSKNFSSQDSDSSVFSTRAGDKTREGWENIAWRVISPLPRIKTIVKGYLDQVGQDIFVDTIDPMSNDMKENMKWRLFAIAQNYDFIAEYHLKAGIPMQELEFLPVSSTELNLFEAMGGFKTNFARAMEKLIKHTEDISDVDDFLKDEWLDDAMDLGFVASRVVFDQSIGKYKYRYIDPKYLVIQYVKDNDYSRSEWAGYVERYTISELKQLMPETPEEEFQNVAFKYRGLLGNKQGGSSWDEFDNFSKHDRKTGAFNYDDFIVDVLEAEWIDYEASRHLIYDSVHGRKSVIKLSDDSEVKPLTDKQKKRGAKQQDLKTKMRKLRGAKMIIGTDTVFDYGEVNMYDRPSKTAVEHSFKLYTLRDQPLTEQLIPIADDMALAWYRYQDDRANAQRQGWTIDVGMMENIDLGGGSFKFVDVLKAWRETRYLFHQQSMSGKYEGGSPTPIQPIPSMLMEAINEFIVSWESAVKRIEDVTGISLVMLGAPGDPSTSATATKISAEGTFNVLKPTIKIVGRLKKELAQVSMRRLQLALKARPDITENYSPVVGEADLELLKIAEKDAVQYGMTFEARPSAKAKADLIAGAQLSLQQHREGKAGLAYSHYQYIVTALESGSNIKELSAMIDYLTMKSQRDIDEKQQQNIEIQNKGLADMEQKKMEGAAQQQQIKTKGELAVEGKKTEGRLMEIQAQQQGQQNPPVAP